MYRTILLAYEGSLAGRRALREGANIAIKFGAATHLLAVMKPSLTANMGHDFDGGHLVDEELKYFRDTLSEGVDLLKEWGLDAEGHLVWGDPATEISRTSREVAADLVVVGHDPQGRLGALVAYTAQLVAARQTGLQLADRHSRPGRGRGSKRAIIASARNRTVAAATVEGKHPVNTR